MKIQQVMVQQKRLSSAEAELLVFVSVDSIEDSTALHGGLVGPTCPGVETVQISYPLKPVASEGDKRNMLAGRIIIPDPNLWSPKQPLVYEGTVELWQGGKCVEVQPIRAAFKGRME